MLDGGFLVKFVNKEEKVEEHRRHEVSFRFDPWTYKLNNEEEKIIPPITKIEVIPEKRGSS